MIFLGRYDEAHLLAGIGVGNMMTMFGLSFIMGLNSAIETLVSQAKGAGNIELCGVYLNRGRFVLMLVCVPVAVILS